MAGFTQVPNELIDSMCDFSPAEFKAIIAVWRLIMGYEEYRDKQQRRYSLNKLAKYTGLSKQGVFNAMESLENRGLISKVNDGGVTVWVVNSVDHLNGQLSVPVVNSVDMTGQLSLPPSIEINLSKEKEDIYPPIKNGFAYELPETPIANEQKQAVEEMAAVLATVTRMELSLNADKLNNFAFSLLENDYKPSQVSEWFGDTAGYWYQASFGRQGQPPKLGHIRSEIGVARDWKLTTSNGNGNGHHNHRSDKQTTLENIQSAIKAGISSRNYQTAISKLSEYEQGIFKALGSWYDVRRLSDDELRIKIYQGMKL